MGKIKEMAKKFLADFKKGLSSIVEITDEFDFDEFSTIEELEELELAVEERIEELIVAQRKSFVLIDKQGEKTQTPNDPNKIKQEIDEEREYLEALKQEINKRKGLYTERENG